MDVQGQIKDEEYNFRAHLLGNYVTVKSIVEWAVPLIACLTRVFFKRLTSAGEFTGYRDKKPVASRV